MALNVHYLLTSWYRGEDAPRDEPFTTAEEALAKMRALCTAGSGFRYSNIVAINDDCPTVSPGWTVYAIWEEDARHCTVSDYSEESRARIEAGCPSDT